MSKNPDLNTPDLDIIEQTICKLMAKRSLSRADAKSALELAQEALDGAGDGESTVAQIYAMALDMTEEF